MIELVSGVALIIGILLGVTIVVELVGVLCVTPRKNVAARVRSPYYAAIGYCAAGIGVSASLIIFSGFGLGFIA